MDTTYAESDKVFAEVLSFALTGKIVNAAVLVLQQNYYAPSPAFNKVLALLRKTKSYWLVGYLPRSVNQRQHDENAGEDYGVSYTHFRRLCSRALGGKAENWIRNWRMAQSLLRMV